MKRAAAAAARTWYECTLFAIITVVAIDGETANLKWWSASIITAAAGSAAGLAIGRANIIRRQRAAIEQCQKVIGWYAASTGKIWPPPMPADSRQSDS